MGIVNTIGTVPGVLANWFAGYVLSQPGGSWAQVLSTHYSLFTPSGSSVLTTHTHYPYSLRAQLLRSHYHSEC